MSSLTEIFNEQKLIVLASRLTFSEDDEKSFRIIIEENLNWYKVVDMSIRNRVAALLWHNMVSRGYRDKLPRRLQEILELFYAGNAERNKVYIEEINKVLSVLASEGITCAPLKGAYLIPHIYKNYGLRMINDVDCLLKMDDRARVTAVMQNLGYIQGDYDYSENIIKPINRERQIKWKTKMSNLYPFRKLNNSDFCKECSIDFCFCLDYNLDPEPVENMLSQIWHDEISGWNLLTPDAFFIHLCCHLYKEATNAAWVVFEKDVNIIKFCDIREFMLRKMDITFIEKAVQFAKAFKLEKAVYFTLYYLNEIYHDGYEEPAMELLGIDDIDFIDNYGARDYARNMKWKKSFWQRIFSYSNEDELIEKPKFLDN